MSQQSALVFVGVIIVSIVAGMFFFVGFKEKQGTSFVRSLAQCLFPNNGDLKNYPNFNIPAERGVGATREYRSFPKVPESAR